jgi:hypothetical protein
MTTIFSEKDGYTISLSPRAGYAIIAAPGQKAQTVRLQKSRPVTSPGILKAMNAAKKSPQDYFEAGGAVIRISAEFAWDAAVEATRKATVNAVGTVAAHDFHSLETALQGKLAEEYSRKNTQERKVLREKSKDLPKVVETDDGIVLIPRE